MYYIACTSVSFKVSVWVLAQLTWLAVRDMWSGWCGFESLGLNPFWNRSFYSCQSSRSALPLTPWDRTTWFVGWFLIYIACLSVSPFKALVRTSAQLTRLAGRDMWSGGFESLRTRQALKSFFLFLPHTYSHVRNERTQRILPLASFDPFRFVTDFFVLPLTSAFCHWLLRSGASVCHRALYRRATVVPYICIIYCTCTVSFCHWLLRFATDFCDSAGKKVAGQGLRKTAAGRIQIEAHCSTDSALFCHWLLRFATDFLGLPLTSVSPGAARPSVPRANTNQILWFVLKIL